MILKTAIVALATGLISFSAAATSAEAADFFKLVSVGGGCQVLAKADGKIVTQFQKSQSRSRLFAVGGSCPKSVEEMPGVYVNVSKGISISGNFARVDLNNWRVIVARKGMSAYNVQGFQVKFPTKKS